MPKSNNHESHSGLGSKPAKDKLKEAEKMLREAKSNAPKVETPYVSSFKGGDKKVHLYTFRAEIGQTKIKFTVLSHIRYIDAYEIEQLGIPAEAFHKTMQMLQIPFTRVLKILKISGSKVADKAITGGWFEGKDALAIIRIWKLLSLAESIVSNSLHPDAKHFDSGKWLGEWIESPQPALGGQKPSELLSTEAGGQRVFQVLAALESGSYQ